MKKILNALFLTIITLVTFSCSDVPAPYDINEGGGNGSSLEGEGTKENPYTVADAIRNQDGSVAWVKGYIVGIMGNKYKPDGVTFDGNIPVFEPPFTIATNVLIAAKAGETNIKNCLPVKMKGGSALSTALNLKDHPANLGQALIIKGQLSAGFGTSAMIETTAAVFDGKDIGEGGGTDPEPPTGTVLFEETFKTSQGVFTINDVQLPEGSTFVWQWSSFETSGYMKASAFINNQNKAAESWLISPSVDLTKSTEATLVFDHAWKFATDKNSAFTLWVSEAGKNAWQQVTIPNYSDGASWTFVSSGNISMKSYVGKNIQFAFKYVSTTTSAGMWEVKNVRVLGDGGGVDPNPPVEGDKIFTETFGATVSGTTAIASYTNWDNASLTFSSTGKTDLRAIAHKTEANKTETVKVNNIWFPANNDCDFSIANIKAAGYKKFVLNYEAAANIYDIGSTIDLNALKVTFDNIDLVVPSKVLVAASKGGDANIFYEMQVEISVAGTASSTLKFSAGSSTNTVGLRLSNIRLVGVEKGGTDPEPSSSNLVVNPGFEDWTADLPVAWDNKTYNTGITKETAVKHSGNNSLKHTTTSSTIKLQQEVNVEGGKKYRISYWYLDNDTKAKCRMWSAWLAGTTTLDDDKADLQDPTNIKYSVDDPTWKQVSMTLTAPATATKFRFEVRSNKETEFGGSIYFDDFEVVEIK